MCKFVVGLLTKKCKLFLGRDTHFKRIKGLEIANWTK